MAGDRSAAGYAPGTTVGPVAVTVVVSTRNRRHKIETCVRALVALRCRLPWQCVIVDNGSSDGTLGRLRELATVLAPGLQVVSEPRAGVSRGRNAGIRAARGEFIAMTDDDCLPEPDFLDAVLEAFADPAIGYYGGRVLLHDPGDYPITIKTSTEREEFPPGTVLRPGALHGANFGFRRAVLERIGGFDPNLGPGTPTRGGEDVELATRASFGAGAAPTIRGRRCDTTMAGAHPNPFGRWTAATTSGAAPITCVPRSSVERGCWHSSTGTGACVPLPRYSAFLPRSTRCRLLPRRSGPRTRAGAAVPGPDSADIKGSVIRPRGGLPRFSNQRHPPNGTSPQPLHRRRRGYRNPGASFRQISRQSPEINAAQFGFKP